jgi:hypothetical protein
MILYNINMKAFLLKYTKQVIFSILTIIENILDKFPNIKLLRFIYSKLLILKNRNVFSTSWSYMDYMYRDHRRNDFYIKLIEKYCPQNNIIELGGGLGFLAQIMQKNNPKSLTIIEASNKLADKIYLSLDQSKNINVINKYSTDLYRKDLPNEIDYVFHELIAPNIFGEAFIESLNNFRTILPANTRFLPGKIDVMIQPVFINDKIQFDYLKKYNYQLNLSQLKGFDHYQVRLFQNEICCLNYPAKSIFEIDFNEKMKTSDHYNYNPQDYKEANAIILFFKLSEKDIIYSNSPFEIGPLSHWIPKIYQYSNNVKNISISYGRRTLNIRPEF